MYNLLKTGVIDYHKIGSIVFFIIAATGTKRELNLVLVMGGLLG
ncbi:hypothetical protein LD85_0932 [Saccharolobus islandicus L.D.8.5]|uniref:Uncharacterized protein n=1 Tax=Saccharolobus islandicus (strain L.D.8.5 / Lassen \|nr:hypothetical protein LD85_0932 [Sulfolobus islandicus L.D.8.5]